MSNNGIQTKNQWYKHLDFFAIDLVFTMVAYFVACIVRLHQISAEFIEIYWEMALALIPIILLIQLGTNPHREIERRPPYREFYASLEYVSEATIFLLLVQYLLQVGGEFSRGAFIYFWIFGTVLVFVARMLLKKLRNRIQSSRIRQTGIVLVIDGDNPEEKVDYYRTQGEKLYSITAVALLHSDDTAVITQLKEKVAAAFGDAEFPVLTSIDDLYSYAENHSADEILLSISDVSVEQQIIREMLLMGITSHVNLNRNFDGMPHMQVETLADQLVITSSIQPFSPFQRAIKRLTDIVGALVGLVITFLVMLFIGPIIRIQSHGSMFFSQTRVGKNGKKFKMYKFRSMYVDAEKRKAELMKQNEMNGPIFKLSDDPRIIPIGKFIRKFSIDELPQFWNVLMGDMSLVGTRPPTVDEWEQYTAHHKARLAIKPGITGLWQVSGRNEITDFEKIVALDLRYIQDWSLLEDARIILKTIGVVFGAVGAK
ncbi:MAG: sugar transferase [Lachnospiraceae bacterium]|nr:sugar transferase [Lachnospiraceae bacterium]